MGTARTFRCSGRSAGVSGSPVVTLCSPAADRPCRCVVLTDNPPARYEYSKINLCHLGAERCRGLRCRTSLSQVSGATRDSDRLPSASVRANSAARQWNRLRSRFPGRGSLRGSAGARSTRAVEGVRGGREGGAGGGVSRMTAGTASARRNVASPANHRSASVLSYPIRMLHPCRPCSWLRSS